ADTLALTAAVDSPHLRLNLDTYHAQNGDGNLIETCRSAMPWTGQIQVADVPGRTEPGTGEISYQAVAAALAVVGCSGFGAMEAGASQDSDVAIEQCLHTFSGVWGARAGAACLRGWCRRRERLAACCGPARAELHLRPGRIHVARCPARAVVPRGGCCPGRRADSAAGPGPVPPLRWSRRTAQAHGRAPRARPLRPSSRSGLPGRSPTS